MVKFIEKNISIILLAINCYFLFSISNSLKETSNYSSDLRACAKMKAFNNDKELSELSKKNSAIVKKVQVKFISKYCKN